jgi:cell shape-determining protein MreC
MINFVKNIFEKIQEVKKKKEIEKMYKERLKELKKRDPFIYKH